jgi:hypothetical protein
MYKQFTSKEWEDALLYIKNYMVDEKEGVTALADSMQVFYFYEDWYMEINEVHGKHLYFLILDNQLICCLDNDNVVVMNRKDTIVKNNKARRIIVQNIKLALDGYL